MPVQPPYIRWVIAFVEVAEEATRGEVIASRWFALLRAHGATGLTFGGHTVGQTSEDYVFVSDSLTVFGPFEMPEADILQLGALSDCVARWLHRFERFAATSRRAQRERISLRREVGDIRGDDLGLLGTSNAMREVRRLLRVVAPHDTTVFLEGETGTGKELAARALHELSNRKRFVAINCSAISPQLVEAELFGHVRGAFTGANRAREGALRAAGAGTVFLDEVAELSLDAQAKLLRVIQEREIRPVGSDRVLPFRARIACATHRNVDRLVADGLFRQDLAYRLRTFPIRLPALRERPEDVRVLVRAKLTSLARRLERDVPEVSSAVMQALSCYAWPGNVRELENELERALLLSDHQLLWDAPRVQTRVVGPLDGVIRAAIEDALRQTRGKIYGADGAAQLLGLAPSTLQTKMRKHGIERDDFVQ